jgi:hypothetical protein
MWPFRRRRRYRVDPVIARWLVDFQKDPEHAPNKMSITRVPGKNGWTQTTVWREG